MTSSESNESYPAKPRKPTALTTYLEDTEVAEIDRYAAICGLTRAGYVRIIMRKWLAEKSRNPSSPIVL